MTIAASIYKQYQDDDTTSVDDIIEKCRSSAVEVKKDEYYSDGVGWNNIYRYQFDDDSCILHYTSSNKLKVHLPVKKSKIWIT